MDTSKRYDLLGGEIEIVLYDICGSTSEMLFGEIHQEAIRLQGIFNFFDPDSELSRLNRQRELSVSEELLEVVKKALYYCEITKGTYDISKGSQIRSRKSGIEIDKIHCSYKDVIIKDNLIILSHLDVLVDLGSIAKGYIVDRLIGFMKEQGIKSGFIDARGDMRIFGKHIEVVETQDPRSNNASFDPIILENKAIATSGDYNQYQDTSDACHIIGKTDLISVTVVSDTLMESDVLATCLFLLGQKESKMLLSRLTDIRALLINNNQEMIKFNNFEEQCLEGKI